MKVLNGLTRLGVALDPHIDHRQSQHFLDSLEHLVTERQFAVALSGAELGMALHLLAGFAFFGSTRFGVDVGRGGWLEKKDVFNTLTLAQVTKELEKRKK